MATWYDEKRVAYKGSVVLRDWNESRNQERKKKENALHSRGYAGAAHNRLTSDWTSISSSADSEILQSLSALRARSRQVVRDNAHARNAVRIVQNNVVGTGIGVQAQVSNARGTLIDSINSLIEEKWVAWCDKTTCHTAGLLGFPEMMRLIMAQLVEAGEVVIRKVRRPFGGGRVSLALEILEADRLMDQWQTAKAPNGNAIRMGVEVDEWGRPQAYWFHPTHPGDYQFTSFVPSKFIRVPADEVIHLYIVERWPQTRGVPWFHAVLRRINDMKGYSDAEIVAARASANIVGFIKAPELAPGDDVAYGQRVIDSEPGTFRQLLPGEDFVGFNPSRPNAALEPFMRFMLREMAAGVGVSYEALSRDYSQSNYSSSRLSLLDDRDLWRVLQGWLIRNFVSDIYREWLSQAVISGELNIPDFFSNQAKYEKVRFKPRGWSWIDPTKEVSAFRSAVRAGFMTVADVIAQTSGGQDAEDVFKSRRQELDMMDELELTFDTDVSKVDITGKDQPAVAAEIAANGGSGDGAEEEPEEEPDEESAEESAD